MVNTYLQSKKTLTKQKKLKQTKKTQNQPTNHNQKTNQQQPTTKKTPLLHIPAIWLIFWQAQSCSSRKKQLEARTTSIGHSSPVAAEGSSRSSNRNIGLAKLPALELAKGGQTELRTEMKN